MFEINIEIPNRQYTDAVVGVVERVCSNHKLNCTLKGTLAKYPGSVHWHFKQGKQKGILEITWWELENRLWFKVADGRTGPWIKEGLPQIKTEIERALQ